MLLRSDSVAGKPRQDAYFDEESDDDDPGPRLANMDNKLRVDSDAYFDQESDDDDLGPRLVNMENKSQVDAVLTASPDTSLTWCSTPSPLRGARQMGATPSPCVSPQPECATPSRLRNLSRASSNETSPLQGASGSIDLANLHLWTDLRAVNDQVKSSPAPAYRRRTGAKIPTPRPRQPNTISSSQGSAPPAFLPED